MSIVRESTRKKTHFRQPQHHREPLTAVTADPAEEPKYLVRRITNFLLVAGFLGGLYVPLVVSIATDGQQVSEAERRELATLVPLSLNKRSIREFPDKFEAYYNDHFGLRDQLTKANSWARYHILKTSSSPRVAIGKNEWLFLADKDVIADYQGRNDMSPERLFRRQGRIIDSEEQVGGYPRSSPTRRLFNGAEWDVR
ncbi:MAG: hypothetical protein IH914_02330 [candidate division Zixibacteria bacterium]|nr:hypothetical protein [candidate division Zixibacteria bacterium]